MINERSINNDSTGKQEEKQEVKQEVKQEEKREIDINKTLTQIQLTIIDITLPKDPKRKVVLEGLNDLNIVINQLLANQKSDAE